MNTSRLLLIGFVIVSIGELLTIALQIPLQYIFKPAILIMLTGFYLSTAVERNSSLIGALFFCWVGDICLMFSGDLYFMIGLLAFLTGHILYIITFRHFSRKSPSLLLPTQKVRYLLPIFLAGTGLILILYPGLGSLKIPVVIYAIVLMIMVSAAMMRATRTSAESFGFVLVGAISFMLSDSLLAVNKFYASFSYAHVSIMASYIGAQYLIVKGLLRHA